MSELKTQKNDASVEAFLNGVPDEKKRHDSFVLLDLMREVTGQEPAMWGASIVGFGSYRYRYASGREGEWFQVGFSPRKQNLTIYVMSGFAAYDTLLAGLGKYKTGQSCLYVKRLEDLDLDVLRELIKQSMNHLAAGNSASNSG
ncbi:MAG: DUF1801 domain-containing protein [Anaerolineae bacterium]|nr:DUF1801 domain-containing protein [Anaerolineae bacterium]